MKVEELIAIVPDYLQANPTALSAEALNALDQILEALDTVEVERTRADFVNWLRTYRDERDRLKFYAEANREVGQQSPAPESAEAKTLQNYFQTARQVRCNQSPNPDRQDPQDMPPQT
ncbi:MAG: hypothetical protein F6J95_020125 [Leptolyngbya sp. SIO1E4]|nr:hypothetical protein [Leptolyngbya sp. SIO1E4]